jgi:methyltransferase (TIGR00027 family)
MTRVLQTDFPLELSDVAETALVTLFCRAIESASPGPLIHDPAAEDLAARLRPRLAKSSRPLQRALSLDNVESEMRMYVSLRSRHFDQRARDFLARNPEGQIVNLGGGLDTRWRRLGCPKRFLTIDLPEMIALRSDLLTEEGEACDVRDSRWMDAVTTGAAVPVLFLAEGLLMYLNGDENRNLFRDLAGRFPGSELVAEVFNSFWLDEVRREAINNRLDQTLGFGSTARFVSGFASGNDPERWHAGIRLNAEWSFVDENEEKLGRLRKLRHFPRFRKRQWVASYSFEAAPDALSPRI